MGLFSKDVTREVTREVIRRTLDQGLDSTSPEETAALAQAIGDACNGHNNACITAALAAVIRSSHPYLLAAITIVIEDNVDVGVDFHPETGSL